MEHTHHLVLNDFMKGDFDFWLNIDSDNPPRKNPLDLIDLDLDIVGCPTPVWHFKREKVGERPIYWNAYKWNEAKQGYNEWPVKEGLQMVDAIGFGCFLFNRRVFEDPRMRKAPFQRTYHEDGTVDRGLDLAFSERARKNGHRIFAHYGYPCNHFNELALIEVIQAHQELKAHA